MYNNRKDYHRKMIFSLYPPQYFYLYIHLISISLTL